MINSGSADAVERVVIPYLRYHGLGHIDRAIALNATANSGWDTLAMMLPLQHVWGVADEPLVANTAIPGKLPLLVRSIGHSKSRSRTVLGFWQAIHRPRKRLLPMGCGGMAKLQPRFKLRLS
ncbi:MAG: hypothetical protein HC926_04745 [Synechococcaceae cyanobacterium SM2_3_60]|nr:hypothetical protein [Synechococcaceae cyanobacterium SM2_3_60]